MGKISRGTIFIIAAVSFVAGTLKGANLTPGNLTVVGDSGTNLQTNISYDARSYLACDGSSPDTAALSGLLAKIGSSQAKIILPNSGKCKLGSITIPTNVVLDFTSGGAIALVTGQKVKWLGGLISAGSAAQIFYNALPGQGTVDFTGGYATDKVYPEWWGASPAASASTNTPAIQAAIWAAYGCGPVACRVNGSGLAQYNRELRFSGQYSINGELKLYHVNNFLMTGVGKLASGLYQTAANNRIFDAQNVAYGTISNLSFVDGAGVSQDTSHPLIDLQANGSQGRDILDQFITFQDDVISCNNSANIGVEISPNGEDNGNNISFYNVAMKSCLTAAGQIGDPGNLAYNALNNVFVGGDISGSNLYGLAAYGGQWIVEDSTMENGRTNQTGWDVACHATQVPCVMDNVRSESFYLMAGDQIVIKNSKTIFAGLTWDQSALAGTAAKVGQVVTGDSQTGPGTYFRVTVGGTWGGLNSTKASSGSATAIVCSVCSWTTNQWAGMHVGIIGGTAGGAYGIVTSNTATTIIVPSWISNVPPTWRYYSAPPPDSSSVFVVEPNWGSQTTSGTVTFAPISGYIVTGDPESPSTTSNRADIDNSSLVGFQINAQGHLQDLNVSRRDWLASGAAPLDPLSASHVSNVRVYLPQQGGLAFTGIPQLWSYTGGGGFTAASQWNLTTTPLVWSCGLGGIPCNDVWIGGRSDPSATSSISRNILEYGGLLGPPTPKGVNQNALGGAGIECGGLSTGNGIPGNCDIWVGSKGLSGSQVNPGFPAVRINPIGLGFVRSPGQHFFNFSSNSDPAGTCQFNRSTTCRVLYATPYNLTPVVILTPVSPGAIDFTLTSTSRTGFTITASGPNSTVVNYVTFGNPD